jgi:predicted dehydrogenase
MTSIALIGSGIFAKEEHLPAISATSSLTLAAIYSRSRKSAEALAADASGVELYSEDSEGKTYEDLLKREDIKGVVIACVLPLGANFAVCGGLWNRC